MIDLGPVPIPDLSAESMASHRAALVETISKRRHRTMRWATLVGATGVAATVSTLVFLGASGPNAFAGWSAHPTKPAVGQLTSADTSCQGALAQMPASVSQGADLGSLAPEVSDVRGPYTVTVFGGGSNGGAMCISAPDGNAIVQRITWSSTPIGPGAVMLDRVRVLFDSGQPYSLVEGRTGEAVTGVTLTLENGSRVTATIGHGFLLAWWPGSVSATAVVVSTSSGSSTQSVVPASSGAANSVCHNGNCG